MYVCGRRTSGISLCSLHQGNVTGVLADCIWHRFTDSFLCEVSDDIRTYMYMSKHFTPQRVYLGVMI